MAISFRKNKRDTNNQFYKDYNKNNEFNIEKKHIPALFNIEFWDKYLGKGDFLVFHENGDYHFFMMKQVINFIITKANWRILKSKRLKEDFGNRLSGIITFEERKDKRGLTEISKQYAL